MLQHRLVAAVCAVAGSFVLASGTAFAHPGALDATFAGGTGVVSAQLGSFSDGASAVAQTSDGGVIIAGFVPTSNTTPIRRDLGLVALDASGNPRAGFGTGGHVTIPLPNTVSASASRAQITVAQRSDGSFLVGAVGLTGANFSAQTNIIVDTVSAGGVAAAASDLAAPAAFTTLTGVAADGADGFIYFAGQDGAGPSHTVAVSRATVAGALDPGFGTAGVAAQAVDAGNTANFGPIAVGSDGKPVVAVAGTKADNTTHEASLVRFTTGGQPDTGFGTGGVATLPASSGQTTAGSGLRIAFAAAGIASLWSRAGFTPMVVRFTSAGQAVTSFGGTGAVGVGNGGLASPSDLAFGDDGTVIVIGQDVVADPASPGAERESAYANRLLANGTHDTSFGDNPINGYGPFASWWNGATNLYTHSASVMTPRGLVAVGQLETQTGSAATSSAFAAARIITAANRPPTTSLAVSPGSAINTATFRFTASAHDPDFGGSIVSYQWDFNGDGVVDRITTTPITSYMYSRAGHYTAHVRAFDNEGGSTDASTHVTVTSAAAAAVRALRGVSTKLSIGTVHHGKRPVTISFGKLASTAGPCQYFAVLRRGRTVLGTAQGSADRRHTKITFSTTAGRGATLTATIRLIDTFSNRVDKRASAKIRH